MTALERAKYIIGTTPTDQLLDVWEMTTTATGDFTPTVRGWLMDEFEKRCPEEYGAWLETDTCEDGELRKYITGGRR